MGRKIELGLRYFSHDTDCSTDRNIKRLTRKFGAAGYGVFMCVLEAIYREGHYVSYSDDFVFDIADRLNMDDGDEEYVRDVINQCVECDLFDKQLFDQGILTSHGIQARYFAAKEASLQHAHNTGCMVDYQYLLIDINEYVKTGQKTRKDISEFGAWMNKNYPQIAKFDIPLTETDYNEIVQTYGVDIVTRVMASLDNKRDAKRKYTNAKTTILSWIKVETNNKNGNATNDIAGQLAALSRNRRQGQRVLEEMPR